MASGNQKTLKQKKKNNILRKYAIYLFIPLPAVLGMIGFRLEGEDFWNAAFSCLTMYLIEYGDPTSSVWIQLARWLAPLATASGLTLVFASVSRFAKRIYAGFSKKSVAVFGEETEKQMLLEELGARGISMEDSALRAGRYILVGSEEENLDFYRQNREEFGEKDVYLKCRALPEQVSSDPKLHLFSPEETSARIFWKEHCPYALSKEWNHHLKIAILGFGGIGKELIIQGLQYNIFSPDQVMEYHIFGEDDGFANMHPQLSQITDPVVFHQEPWYAAVQLMEDCQMVIVVQQENQLDLLQGLALLFPHKPIYVFAAQTSGVEMLEKNTGIVAFDWNEEALRLENILGTRTHYLAKKLNLRYAHLYGGVEETEENMEAEWRKLNTFTRYSNISSANYYDVCVRILEGRELTEERLRFLGELEHIRWCRYHYLNNWKYGIPENGKAKDPRNRIHSLLVPNNQLIEAEQEKDRENVRLLRELQEAE